MVLFLYGLVTTLRARMNFLIPQLYAEREADILYQIILWDS